MDLFKSKLWTRIAIAKSLGFLFWLIGFYLLPVYFSEADLMLRFAILFWYTTLGWIIGIFGIMDRHPVFTSWSFPFWFRWILLWAWMNFLLVMFIYNDIINMIQWTCFEGYSPFWIITEWMVIWLIIEFFATKYGWEWKELMK